MTPVLAAPEDLLPRESPAANVIELAGYWPERESFTATWHEGAAVRRIVGHGARWLRWLLQQAADRRGRAITATLQQGETTRRVTVRALHGPDGELVLEVTDDGRGIPEEYRERVLQVFERLDAPKSSPGTGMGLAICRRIAESLGGTLVVDGPPPDAGTASGTTVRTVLPAALVVERPDPAKVGQNA